ncbi:hypothetical protein ANCCEY_00271 [Ancylostoma ceylanicum]|uniref:Major facilitator superfamily (MFS) profile domain-containing protein n=1 Tax=Ancylostoma ceylanicum TaxID=53326 RepID=A0A0D6MAL2_9BILA|nr:hypothetical protein ANCCEY_00271 [Ancylostoma ceylanicum]
MIVGGAILAGIFSLNHSAPELTSLLNTTSGNAGHAYRQFSDMEIRMMYGAFTAVTLCANLILALTPSREIPDCIEGKHNKLRRTFKEELGEEKMYFEPKKLAEIDHCAIADMVLAAFLNKRMIALSPLFLHLGFYGSFWICVYPTTLVFTKSLSNHIYLPAFYSLTVGTGEVVMGVIISTLSKRIKDFGLKPTMYCAFGLTTVILAVMVAAVPKSATVGLTDEPAWLVQPSVVLSVFTAFLIGLADSAANNVRTVICALALPDRRAQAFAISKFYQALAGTILMFLSPYLSIFHYTALLFFTLCLSTSCFVHVAGKTKRMERESIRQYLDAKDVLPEKY